MKNRLKILLLVGTLTATISAVYSMNQNTLLPAGSIRNMSKSSATRFSMVNALSLSTSIVGGLYLGYRVLNHSETKKIVQKPIVQKGGIFSALALGSALLVKPSLTTRLFMKTISSPWVALPIGTTALVTYLHNLAKERHFFSNGLLKCAEFDRKKISPTNALRLVKIFHFLGADLNYNSQSEDRNPLLNSTPLIRAVMNGDKAMVQFFLNHRVSIGKKTMQSALMSFHPTRNEIVQLLLEGGASPFCLPTADQTRTALCIAEDLYKSNNTDENQKLVKMLFDTAERQMHEKLDELKYWNLLIRGGYTSQFVYELLHPYPILYNESIQSKIVDKLKVQYAKEDLTKGLGMLFQEHNVSKKDNEPILFYGAKLLLMAGASPNASYQEYPHKPLQMARQYKYDRLVTLLIQYGATEN